MEKFIVLDNVNDFFHEKTLLVLTDEDIENETDIGFGIEFLILPKKYKNIENSYVENIKMFQKFRKGKTIYI